MYSPEMTLREARRRYFELNDFGPEGGYGDRWVKVRAGPIPVWFPNVEGRRKAVRFHDLHHILTGYGTTWKGEAEIGAWEVSTGVCPYPAGLLLDLMGLAVGLIINPGGVYRAFLRGRRGDNLFAREWSEDLLARTVGECRRGLRLDAAPGPATPRDVAGFAAWSVASVCACLLVAGLILSPFVFLTWLLLRAAWSI